MNYFERLASSALETGAGVKPVVRPRFLDRRPLEAEPPGSFDPVVGVPEAPDRATDSIPLDAAGRSEPETTFDPPSPPASLPAFEPLFVEAPDDAPLSPAPFAAPRADPRRTAERDTTRARRPPAARRAPGRPEAAAGIAVATHRSRPAEPPHSIVRESHRPGREKPVPRELDEIQIHIGRIEVIAVPPSPPPPRPPAVRRSLDLADYLENGK